MNSYKDKKGTRQSENQRTESWWENREGGKLENVLQHLFSRQELRDLAKGKHGTVHLRH